MMNETEQLIINDRPGGFWSSFSYYVKQPRIIDWLIGFIIVGAIVATIIVCI